MTSEEITGKQKTCSDPKATPLWEIAYQLAVLNERESDTFRLPRVPANATISFTEADPEPGKRDADSERGTSEFERYIKEYFPYAYKTTIGNLAAHRHSAADRGTVPCEMGNHRFLEVPTTDSVCKNCGLTAGQIWDLQANPPRAQPADPAPATGSQSEKVQFRGEVFPKIAIDRPGRWGVWFGPGPPLQSFESEEFAREYLKKISDRMSE